MSRNIKAMTVFAGMILWCGHTAFAECISTPDCEDLGYTSASCPQGGVKCPWDVSKQFCGCDGIYQYKCIGRGYVGGEGKSCEDKYVSCRCANRYKWENGACVLDCSITECKVGSVLYSDGSCSYCRLEKKTPIGVVGGVVGPTRYVVALDEHWDDFNFWSDVLGDVPGIDNFSKAEAQKSFDGAANTKAYIAAAGELYDAKRLAAIPFGYCHLYKTAGTSSGQWYFPALGELYMIAVTNFEEVNDALLVAGGTPMGEGQYYWSSSEASGFGQKINEAWMVHAGSGRGNVGGVYKMVSMPNRCMGVF